MTEIYNERKTKKEEREFVIGVYRERGTWTARKFEICHGQRIPLDEVPALDINGAVIQQDFWFHQLHNFRLN